MTFAIVKGHTLNAYLIGTCPEHDRVQKKVTCPLYCWLQSNEHIDGEMNNIRLVLASLCLVLLMISTQSYAQLYKWVDADGNVHYGDDPPESAKLEQIAGEVHSYTTVSVEAFDFDPNKTTQSNGAKTVVIYSTSWCDPCRQAARHFRKNSISFTEHDIEKSAYAAREYKKLNGRGVPVILIGEKRMNGFKGKTFDKVYNEKS